MDGIFEQVRIAIHSIWLRRWLALGVAWGLCLVGWLVVALLPNSYESQAKLFVQTQGLLSDRIGVTTTERQAAVDRVRQTLTSTTNLEKVVRRTDLNKQVVSDRDLAGQVSAIREKIKVTALPDNVLEIKAEASSPALSNAENARLSTTIVQNLLDLFVEDNLSGGRGETQQAIRFFDGRIAALEKQMMDAEQKRVAFETRYMGLLPGEGSISQRMSAARMELSNIDSQLAAAQGALAAARGQLAGTPPTIQTPNFAAAAPMAAIDPGAAQVAALEGQLSQAYARGWTDAHPDVVATKSQLARTRSQNRGRAAPGASGGGSSMISTPNPAYSSLRSMVAEKEALVNAANSRKGQLQADMASMSARQVSEPGVAAEQERLNRDYDVLKRQYDKLLEDREAVRLRSDVASQTSPVQFKVIEPPSRPTIPATPNRPLLLTAILFLGLGAGAAAAFAAAQLKGTFPSARRLADATGLPVLGTVSEVVTAPMAAVRRRQLTWLAGGGGALAACYALLMMVELFQRAQVA
ncbi:MAG TPA: XrtA system polysaccharide chain length determinant [Sphingomonadaceae bacterium]|nr:XrtA system polysaccharide chain length determinant [Sphingomonadaceae bacterium]